MPNALAWLTGRDDLTGQPDLPFGIDSGRLLARSPLDLGVQNPVLAPYYPSPSERFSGWISDLLGAGPGASLAKQNFATGVPNLLQATPLGIGLSAADLLHAKAADDPAGVAAAAIGMVPGVGGEARAVKNLIPWQDETNKALKMIEHALAGKPAPQFQPKPLGVKPPHDTDVALSAIHDALNSVDDTVAADAFGNAQSETPIVDTAFAFGKGAKATEADFADAINASGTHVIDPVTEKTVKVGQESTPIENPLFTKNEVGYFDLATKQINWVHKANTIQKDGKWYLKEGFTPPSDAFQTPPASSAKPPIYDYQKDDNGLYHIFDMVSGKTQAYMDTELEAKAWMQAAQKAKSPAVSNVKTIPITESKPPASKPFDEVANKDYPQLPNYWKPNPAFDSKVTGLIRKDFSPVDWKNYTPQNARNEAVTPKLAVDPSHVESLGGNTKLALWKGGSIAGYPKELPDMTGKVVPNSGEPAKEKFEKAFFLADRPSVADSYIVGHDKVPSPYVALPKNVVETDWTDLAKKFKQYAPQATSAAHYSPVLMKYIIDAAREHGADMAIVHNIHDLGGPQTQYVVLNTNALRAPTAKFDPSKLHLRYPLAGLAGAGIYTAAEEGEEKQ